MISRRLWGWDPFLTFPAVGGLMLGFAGLAHGFYGQAGTTAAPLGFVLGVAIGAAAALLKFRVATFVVALLIGGASLSGAMLYWRLPEDGWQGLIIDAEVRGCDPPSAFVSEAIVRWDRSDVEEAGWRSPRAGWKEDVPRMIENDRGVVLTLLVHRQREVFKQGKPWNRGQLRATRWASIEELERHFARFAGTSCDGYLIGARRFFSPEWEASSVSPPDILPTLLGLHVLLDVPPQLRPFAAP